MVLDFAGRLWRDRGASMPTAVKTCRSSGDNHDHRNAKTGDAAEPLPE
jgi:hypothetical protein